MWHGTRATRAAQTQAQRVLLVEPAGTEGEAPERRTKKKKK